MEDANLPQPSRRLLWPGGETTYTRHESFQLLQEPSLNQLVEEAEGVA